MIQIFSYRARDRAGKIVTGKVESADITQAAKLIRDKNLVITRLSPERKFFAFLGSIRKSVGENEVSAFTRQVSIMISAGITLTESLSIAKSQSSGTFAVIIDEISRDIEGGSSFSSALGKHQDVFSQIYISLVRAGEKGGLLDVVMARLNETLDKQREFKNKIRSALIYPIIVIIGMIIVTAIMMFFVIPKLADIYGQFNAELPVMTLVLVGISQFVVKFWYIVTALAVAGFWGFSVFIKTPFGKQQKDKFLLSLPVVGQLNRRVILTEFTRTLGLLLGAGVSILDALNVVAPVTGNKVLSAGVEKAAKNVEKGFPLAYALAQDPDIFPPVMTRMLAVGEETGKLNEVLEKVSYIFETDSEQQLKVLTSIIEPLIMVVLGIGVGLLVFAIIMPIYNLTSQF
ncbi:type II secretion system F family protein [Candidatus Microgenomates bacterium]|nr:type II secretion system F family protein [Candidatus Microgenomates bacterium]